MFKITQVAELKHSNCLHVTEVTPKCDDDLLLHFPYEDHYNDVTCHQAIATQYGVGVSLQFDVDRKSNVACFTGGTHFQVGLQPWADPGSAKGTCVTTGNVINRPAM